MKILVVGGTGLIGGHAALYLRDKGHDVTVMARSKPATPALAALPFIQGNYAEDEFTHGELSGFDWLVFAAGADGRHMPLDGSVTEAEFYERYNVQGVPRFFEAARDAGITKAVAIGSFYPHVVPQAIENSVYVRSRKLSDEAVRALNSERFTVCSLNAPVVLGHLPGLDVPHIAAIAPYVKEQLPDLPVFAPAGGTNHMSVVSLSEAILGALEKGEGGRAYLVGDENISWKDYFEAWARLAGAPKELPVRDDEHPLLPDVIMYAGRGATVSYEPEGVDELGYSRHRVLETIADILGKAA